MSVGRAERKDKLEKKRAILSVAKEVVNMVTKVQKWGNSQGLRVSKEILEKVHIAVGDTVDVSIQKGSIFIQPVKQLRGRYCLKDLITHMPKDYKRGKEDWGKPMGKEVW